MKLKDLDEFIKKLDDWPLKNSQDRLDRGYISYKLGTLRYLLINKVIKEGEKKPLTGPEINERAFMKLR